MSSFEDGASQRPTVTLGEFAQRVFVVAVIGALAYALWRLADLALLLFAAILFVIGLRPGARFIAKRTGAGVMAGLGVVVVLLLAVMSAALWFFGTVAADQLDEVARQVPTGLRMLLGRI